MVSPKWSVFGVWIKFQHGNNGMLVEFDSDVGRVFDRSEFGMGKSGGNHLDVMVEVSLGSFEAVGLLQDRGQIGR